MHTKKIKKIYIIVGEESGENIAISIIDLLKNLVIFNYME